VYFFERNSRREFVFERESMCVSERYIEREKEIVYLCVRVRERESMMCVLREREIRVSNIYQSLYRACMHF
jgi:hypothetical protein